MYYRVLSGEDRLRAFQQGFEAASGNAVALEYLQGARVIGLFRRGRMIGGFVLNRGPQLRYADMLQHHCARMPFELSQVVEITCYFLVEKSPLLSSLAGLVIALECWRSGSDYVLAGTRIEKVYRTHSRVIPNVFHQGLVETPKGRQYWWFYWAERRQLPALVSREIVLRYWPRRKGAVPVSG
ncbi:hypothetical protein [Marinobacter sp. SS21]|uniref:hypothetical protein n=1 Tax=Marinobacter sp. SS21 TaxID=2979460 RepID=UPI00232B1562|nr:hypothetical protein [Marinobacter sp. SS21]MDC0661190.1 hypothetical protein [Marinobacter sp. SS21]